MDIRTLTDRVIPSIDSDWAVPGDIFAAISLVVVADAVLLNAPEGIDTVGRLVGLPVVLFVPGYLLAAVLFPYRRRRRSNTGGGTTSNAELFDGRSSLLTRQIRWTERVALSFGLSLAIVPLLALVVGPVAGSLSRASVLGGLTASVLVGSAAALVRRNSIPERERYRVPVRQWAAAVRETAVGSDRRLGRILSVVMLCSVAAGPVALGAALVTPPQAESYTSATLLTEGADGQLTASGYPTEFTTGSSEELTLRIENSEGTEMAYTVVADLQRVSTADGAVTVTHTERLLRERLLVEDGDTRAVQHTLTPTMTGETLRVSYYVYRGDIPDDPAYGDAYRKLHLWVTVSGSAV